MRKEQDTIELSKAYIGCLVAILCLMAELYWPIGKDLWRYSLVIGFMILILIRKKEIK